MRPDVGQIMLSNRVFYGCMMILGGTYVLLIVSMLLADGWYVVEKTAVAAAASAQPWKAMVLENPIAVALSDHRIRYSVWLSLVSCTLSALLSVIVAVPIGYLLSRHRFPGKRLLDAVLDIPIVLPPLVVGLSLLILFQFKPFAFLARDVVYQVPAVVLAQFSVACAFAVRTMKSTFDHINPRCEQVAIALGSSRVAGVRMGRTAGSDSRNHDGVHAGLGSITGRIRTIADIRRSDSNEDRGAFDDCVP